MIATIDEFKIIVYVLRRKAIGTAEYKRGTKKGGLMFQLHKSLKSKAKTAKIEDNEHKLIYLECFKYLQLLKSLAKLRMNKPIIEGNIKLLESVIDKIKKHDNKRSS